MRHLVCEQNYACLRLASYSAQTPKSFELSLSRLLLLHLSFVRLGALLTCCRACPDDSNGVRDLKMERNYACLRLASDSAKTPNYFELNLSRLLLLHLSFVCLGALLRCCRACPGESSGVRDLKMEHSFACLTLSTDSSFFNGAVAGYCCSICPLFASVRS